MATILRSFKYISLFNNYNLKAYQPSYSFIQCALRSQSTNHLMDIKNSVVRNVFHERFLTETELLSDIKLKYSLYGKSMHGELTDFLRVMYNKLGTLSGNNSVISEKDVLMLIRCCGKSMGDELPKERIQILHTLTKLFKMIGVKFDLSYYNALLETYLENETDFPSADIVLEMLNNNIQPNKLTYEYLITYYCQKGSMSEANKILHYFKENEIPIDEHIFSALIMGNAEANDMESALDVFNIMKSIGCNPSTKAYTALLCSYAKKGDMGNIMETLKTCALNMININDKCKMEIIYHLAVNGHADHVDKILSLFNWNTKLDSTISDVILKLIDKKQTDVAFKLLVYLKKSNAYGPAEIIGITKVFIRNIIKLDLPIKEIIKYLNTLEEMKSPAFEMANYQCFMTDKTHYCLSLFKAWQSSGTEIKEHFFWPILKNQGAKDTEGMFETLKSMKNDFNVEPREETLQIFVFPFLKSVEPRYVLTALVKTAKLSANNVINAALYYSILNNEESVEKYVKLSNEYGVNLNLELLQPLVYDSQNERLKQLLNLSNYRPNTYNRGVNRGQQESYLKNKLEMHQILNTIDTGYKLRNSCEKGDLLNAEACLNKLRAFGNPRLNLSKFLSYVDLLVKEDKIADALQVISEFVSKNMTKTLNGEELQVQCLKSLNLLAEKGSIEGVNMLFEVLKKQGVKINKEMVEPLISVQLVHNNLEAVLRVAKNIYNEYQLIPMIRELMEAFIKAEDVNCLQQFTDLINTWTDRNTTVLHLAYAFLRDDREHQSRKLLESLDGRIPDVKLAKFMNALLMKDDLSKMTRFIHTAKGISAINRHIMYTMLLEKYSVLNMWQEGLELWHELKTENFEPKELFLSILSQLLQRNNQPIPFSVAEIKDDKLVYAKLANMYFEAGIFPQQQYLKIMVDNLNNAGDINTIEAIYNRWQNSCQFLREGFYKFKVYEKANKVENFLEAVNKSLKSNQAKAFEKFSKSIEPKCLKYFLNHPEHIPLFESLAIQMDKTKKFVNPMLLLVTLYSIANPAKSEKLWNQYLQNFTNYLYYYQFAFKAFENADCLHLLPGLIRNAENMGNLRKQLFYEALLASFDERNRYEEGMSLILKNIPRRFEEITSKDNKETDISKLNRIQVSL